MPGPDWALLPAMAVAGALAGGAWILVPTLARAYAGVSELITTLLLNFVALLLVCIAFVQAILVIFNPVAFHPNIFSYNFV